MEPLRIFNPATREWEPYRRQPAPKLKALPCIRCGRRVLCAPYCGQYPSFPRHERCAPPSPKASPLKAA